MSLLTGFRTSRISVVDDRAVVESEDGRALDPADNVVVLTGFRPDLSFLSELRLDLDPTLEAPRNIAADIDPNIHSCGSVRATGAADLAQPEPDLYLVGMKSYGRAPTFLALTGYEQIRSIVAVPRRRPRGRGPGGAGAPGHRGLRRRRSVRRARGRSGRRMLHPIAARGAHDRGAGDVLNTAPRGVLAALCVTVTISYGTLYYAFAVLAPTITADTGWSLTAITAAFSLGLLMSGVAGVVVGRSIQARGPRGAMVAGALVASAGLAMVGAASSYPWFLVAMLLCGTGAAGLFYAPAFAALTHWYGAARVRALTTLTLVAGFASTVFAPLTTALAEQTSWRTTYLLFAGLLLVVAVPTHVIALRHPWPVRAESEHATPDREVVRSPAFLLAAAGATLTTLAMFAALVALIPLLVGRGMTPTLAAWALGLGGAGQVLGRLAFPRLTAVTDVRQRVLWGTAALALTTLALAVVPGPAAVLIAVSMVAGAARGLYTLVGATLVSDLWGPERYAAINGVLGAPVAVATALGPFAGAWIADVAGGYPATFAVLAGLAAVGSVLSVAGGPARATAITRR